MENSLVSVIVPCYNQAKYLDECLDTVFNQTYTNWECIIINDGSPDNVDEIAEKWCKKDARFRYLKKKNGGVSSARNYGINSSFGKFILPLDADDKIGFDFIVLALPNFNNSNIKIVFFKTWLFGEKNEPFNIPAHSLKKLALNNTIVNTALYKRSDWERIGGYDENMKYGLEDWEFWINLLKDGGDVIQLDSVQCFYRIKKGSRTDRIELDKEKKKETLDYVTAKHAAFYFTFFGNPLENYSTINRKLVKIALKLTVVYNSIKTFFRHNKNYK
jgi:glycosyltransferase involved in cell wall biosynthesis